MIKIVFGEDEVANGTLKLKCMQLRDRYAIYIDVFIIYSCFVSYVYLWICSLSLDDSEDEVVTRETYVARIKALLADDAVWGDIGK